MSVVQSNNRLQSCPVCNREIATPEEVEVDTTQKELYRQHRRNHYNWGNDGEYDPDEDPTLSKNTGPASDELDDECQIDTQHFEVTFHDEHVESVVVEAANRHEAEEIADLERTYDGEFIQTIHTERRKIGEPSQASIDYLERIGLLPDDHDVEPEDLEDLNKKLTGEDNPNI